jgi:ABC-2 type transport system ATP-binding protein
MSVNVEDLDKYYGSQMALKNVSFTIKGAGVTGFLGPNGAGKSTMMKILSGVISPSSGTARVNDMDVVRYPRAVKRITGYLPEHNPLYTDMYVKEYLSMTASIYKVPQKNRAVMSAIEMTGLSSECNKKIGSLSKGYRQRVGIATNLLHNPATLILDEPTTGLDPNQIVDIRKLIKEMGKEKTVILSSHIMQEVEAICDKVIIINHGEIVANETMSSLKISDKIIEIEFLERVESKIFTHAPFVEKYDETTTGAFLVKGIDNRDIRAELFRWAVENQLTIIAMRLTEHRLEDVFRLITQQVKPNFN